MPSTAVQAVCPSEMSNIFGTLGSDCDSKKKKKRLLPLDCGSFSKYFQ